MWNTCLLYVVVEIRQLVNEISSFPEVLYKEMIWKIFQNSQISRRSSQPEVFWQNVFLKISQNSQISIFARVSFLVELQAGNLKLLEAALVFQNQSFIDHLQNRCSWIMHKIHSKKLMLESLFNNVTALRTCNSIKEDSDTGAFLWNLQTFSEQLFWITSMNVCF